MWTTRRKMTTEPYIIRTKEEYQYCRERGVDPLFLIPQLQMDFELRQQIQRELFGHYTLSTGDIPTQHNRFYRWMWEHRPHVCEEYVKPLHQYSAVYISHILSRGAFPEISHDPRNINILSFEAHEQWETGRRDKMRIYERNMRTIEILLKEYGRN